MRVALGADHRGFELKKLLRSFLESQGHSVLDLGTDSAEIVDYPDFARKVAETVSRAEADRGVMVGGVGVGACVAANKFPGVRAGLCHDPFSARHSVENDDVNVLCLGARVITPEIAQEVLKTWLAARFSQAERHVRRRDKVMGLEKVFAASTRPAGAEEGWVEALRELEGARFLERLQARDPSLWKEDSQQQALIRNSLGWLSLPETMAAGLGPIKAFAAEIRAEGFERVVILGMGGSSLACEVFRTAFEPAPGHPRLEVLDTIVPGAIASLESRLDFRRTLFIAASKSGSTLEASCLLDNFFHKAQGKFGTKAGRGFAVITDPGTPLERLAKDYRFRQTFLNPPDIGGRFSALSLFGLVPAALMGVDLERLLERARLACAEPAEALRLGAFLGGNARAGRDKLNLTLPASLGAFGLWVEQLVAESTGKEGRGILPMLDSPPEPNACGEDRAFVDIALEGQPSRTVAAARLVSLAKRGHPILRLAVRDPYDLGAQFYLWETATAAAGFLLKVNPFDQPDVQKSKDRTQVILGGLHRGRLPAEKASFRAGGLAAYADPGLVAELKAGPRSSLPIREVIAAHLRRGKAGDYVAILSFLEPGPESLRLLESLRTGLSRAAGMPATLGLGPRYLHSTGQLHKGGNARGLFLLLHETKVSSLEIPGRRFGFSHLQQAQSRGDYEALREAQRRVLRLDLRETIGSLRTLSKTAESMDARPRES